MIPRHRTPPPETPAPATGPDLPPVEVAVLDLSFETVRGTTTFRIEEAAGDSVEETETAFIIHQAGTTSRLYKAHLLSDWRYPHVIQRPGTPFVPPAAGSPEPAA